MQNSEKSWALVTGASSGLGVKLALELAARRFNIALTARTEAAMLRLAEDIRRKHDVEVVVEPLDLSLPEAPMRFGSASTIAGSTPLCSSTMRGSA